MSSSIRNNRDQRWSARTHRERRDHTRGGSKQKTFDAQHTAHSSDTTPPAFTGEPSDTDHKVDHAHELARDILAPRIQTKSANAVTVDRREFYYFKRKITGRRCSCFTIETSPDNQCPICYGVGVVNGFEKHGTITEMLDFTSLDLKMVNCEPNFDQDTRPIYLRLKEGFDQGYIEATLPIRANIGTIDTFNLFQPIFNRGTTIEAFDPTGASAIIKVCEDLEPFLEFDKVRIRIKFQRIDERPIISNFMMRYDIVPQNKKVIFGDLSRAEEDLVLLRSGLYEAYQEIPIFFDGKTISQFDNEDVLYRLRDGRRFLITVKKDNFVAGVNTSWDISARFLIPNIDVGAHRLLI